MTEQTSPAPRQWATLAMVLALVIGVVLAAAPARAQGAVTDLDNAEFRWGLNQQTAGPSHGPGHNLLSAGDISGALSGPNQQITESDWRARSGDVTIEKRSSTGSTTTATWQGTKTDRSGTEFSGSSDKHSGLEMVFSKGVGSVDSAAGTAEIEWDGTVSALYYSGFVYLTISDPVLTVTRSSAVVTATLGGHRSDRENPGEWSPMPRTEVVLADLPRGAIELGGENGFAVSPNYLGIRYDARSGEATQTRTGEFWGAFPADFVDFASEAGGGSFWYSSGTSDEKKIPLPMAISWNSGKPAEMPDPNDSGTSDGIVGQVIGNTVEDILRAAGTDVADTAAAWMDEAWKPVQPGAVTAARDGGTPATTPGDTDEVVVDETFDGYFEEYITTTSPVTAGTVGGTVASIPAASSGGSSGPASTPSASTPSAAAPVTDQITAPVAATLPLTDVVYAQTSASREAGTPTHQWQWWVGAALLALAAVLFYQTVRRKDVT